VIYTCTIYKGDISVIKRHIFSFPANKAKKEASIIIIASLCYCFLKKTGWRDGKIRNFLGKGFRP